MILRMYQRWAERRRFTVEVDEATEGRRPGALGHVHGARAVRLRVLATERGVHRLVRMSPFDSQHRRQTSFASMDVTPFLEDVSSEVDIDEKTCVSTHIGPPVPAGSMSTRRTLRSA